MKKNLILVIAVFFLSCRSDKQHEKSARDEALQKISSFVFINADSLDFYRTVLKEGKRSSAATRQADIVYADGLYYLMKGLHTKALVNLKEAAVLFDIQKNDHYRALSLLGEGSCFKLMGKSDSAIMKYLGALTFFRREKNNFYQNVTYWNLADAYTQKNDPVNARRYAELILASEPYGSKTFVSTLHLRANLFGMSGKIDSALLTDKQGIALAQKFNYPEKLSPFYDNMAQCFMETKQFDSASKYYRKCIYADSSNGRLQLMADTYSQMVSLYGLLGNELVMQQIAARAIALCDSTEYLRGKYAVYNGLNTYYSGIKDWEKSAEVKDSLGSIYKRLINEETEAKAAEYNLGFETDEKEKLISKQEAVLQRNTYLFIFLAIVVVLLAFSIFTLYRSYKAKRLSAVNKAIQDQKDQNVKAVFESEQSERIRIARDLHDSIGQKLSVIKMYLSSDDNNEKMPVLLDEALQEVRAISHNLLPEELNFGLVKAIKSDIEKLQRPGIIQATLQQGPGDYSAIPLPVCLNIIMIFRELLSNIVKHSNATAINVSLALTENTFIMELKDNGRPINKKAITESTGIGWKNIYARINMSEGELQIAGNEQEGNTISIKMHFS